MNEKEILNHITANDKFAIETAGITILEMSDGYAKAVMPVQEKHMNSHRIVHGGALFTLADMTAGAANACKDTNSVTLMGNITYISPGREGILYAEAKEVSSTKRISHYYVTIQDDSGKLIATAQSSIYRRTV